MRKILAMIPARIGSQRLPAKNLALLDGKPLISYAIASALESGAFSGVYVNGDHQVFGKIAARYGARFYLRPAELGSSQTKSDDVVYDFIKAWQPDVLAWVNSTSPLQTAKDVEQIVRHFEQENLDTLFTVRDYQVHALCDEPINYSETGQFALTQDLKPVRLFIYSVMMWRASTFVAQYEKSGCGFFSGKVGYYPLGLDASVIIKRAEDLEFAEMILQSKKQESVTQIKYDSLFYEAFGGK